MVYLTPMQQNVSKNLHRTEIDTFLSKNLKQLLYFIVSFSVLRRHRYDYTSSSNRWNPTYDPMWFYYENLNIQTQRTSKYTYGDPNHNYWLTESLPTTGNPYLTNTFEELSADSSKNTQHTIT